MGSVARWETTAQGVVSCEECQIREQWRHMTRARAALILIECECGRYEMINIKNGDGPDLVDVFRNYR